MAAFIFKTSLSRVPVPPCETSSRGLLSWLDRSRIRTRMPVVTLVSYHLSPLPQPAHHQCHLRSLHSISLSPPPRCHSPLPADPATTQPPRCFGIWLLVNTWILHRVSYSEWSGCLVFCSWREMFKSTYLVFPLPLTNLYNVNKCPRILTASDGWVKPCGCRVGPLVWHEVYKDGKKFDGKVWATCK